MKFAITQFEKLTLVQFLVSRPTQNIDQGEARGALWDDLGVKDMARETARAVAVGTKGPDASPWLDDKKLHLVDIQKDALHFALEQLKGEVPGLFSDTLRPLQRRLLRLEAGSYELPKGVK